jgi:hypothetical protein
MNCPLHSVCPARHRTDLLERFLGRERGACGKLRRHPLIWSIFPLDFSQRLAPPHKGEPPPRCLTPERETHTLISRYSIVIPLWGNFVILADWCLGVKWTWLDRKREMSEAGLNPPGVGINE